MDYIFGKGEVVSLTAGGAASVLTVRRGHIWLTRPDDSRDYLLASGGRLQLEGDGACVLEALADATIALEGIPLKDTLTMVRVNVALVRPVPA